MKLRMIGACLCSIVVSACGAAPEDASLGEQHEAVVRGEPDYTHPYVMALLIPRLDGSEAFCSAVLYGPRTLATAAHCLDNAGMVIAYSGNNFWGDFEQLFEDQPVNWRVATSWKQHPNYDPKDLDSDIAVVHLDRELEFRPIPLARARIGREETGQPVEVVGYGAEALSVTEGEPRGMYSRRVGLSSYVGTPSGSPRALPPNPHPGLRDGSVRRQLMQLDGRAPKANPCFGDSGGPALMKIDGSLQLVGIASWTGDGCEEFSYYVRVRNFYGWLSENALPESK